MLSRIIAAAGTWHPPRGFRVVRVDAREKVGRDEFSILVTVKREQDHWYLTIEHSATLMLTGSQLRDLLPDPNVGIHARLSDMFCILQR